MDQYKRPCIHNGCEYTMYSMSGGSRCPKHYLACDDCGSKATAFLGTLQRQFCDEHAYESGIRPEPMTMPQSGRDDEGLI